MSQYSPLTELSLGDLLDSLRRAAYNHFPARDILMFEELCRRVVRVKKELAALAARPVQE